MKRFVKLALILLLFIPFISNAAVKVVYDDAKWGANTYITDFKNYRWYVDLNTKKKYIYDGRNFSVASGFDYGGLINQSEYNISINKNQTYLKTARSYWTLTSKDSKFYSVENGNFTLFDKNVSAAGVRPTEYIVHQTEVTGQGSYADPWVFVKPDFYVEIEYFNTVIERDGKIIADGIAQYGDTITYSLKLKNNGLRDSVVNTREVAMVSQVNKIIKMLPETSTVRFGNRTLSLSEAKKAIQDLFSDNGYTFTIVPGQEVEVIFKIQIIGNAGDVVNSQVLYTMDGLEADPGNLNKIAVEKTVQYNEVAEAGANVVLILDTSNSMNNNGKMAAMKRSAKEFVDIFLVEEFNGTSEICVVIMAYDRGDTSKYKCSQSSSELKKYITNTQEDGWTPYTESLRDGLTQMKYLKNKRALNSNSVVFLTDGIPLVTSGVDYRYKSYIPLIKEIASLYTIGFMTGYSERRLLLEMVDNDPNYYFEANKTQLSDVFRTISRKINEKSKVTSKGVLAISRNLDKSRNIIIRVTANNGNGSSYEKQISYEDALKESYIINKGNRYEINIKKFKADDKISVTYFLERN